MMKRGAYLRVDGGNFDPAIVLQLYLNVEGSVALIGYGFQASEAYTI